MTTVEYGTHTVTPYEGAGAAFEGIWKRWHQWEWSPENTCRVRDLEQAFIHLVAGPIRLEHIEDEYTILSMFPALKTALATPDLEVGSYTSLESGWEGYSGGLSEVEYDSYPDHEFEAAQEFIAKFESKLLAWCKSIDGGK